MPASARLPTVREEVVNGIALANLPILWMSYSSLRLWMMDPEHMNNIALKNAWLQMWRNDK
jgi:hypothetical protein